MTDQILKRFQEIGRQEQSKDPIVVVKYFNPRGAGTWLATEYFPDEQLFFGYVSIFGDHCDEWGYFSLAELEGLGYIERDLYCGEKKMSKHIPKAVEIFK